MTAPSISASPSAAARARLRRADSELRRVRGAMESWFARRTQLDKQQSLQQYSTQLAALRASLWQALDRIEAEFNPMKSQPQTAGQIFDACSRNELRLAWVQRVWNYYRQKFDQRDDPTWAPLLKAADEVVWSCYKPVFENSGELLRAAPLPYVEPLFSPNAILRDDPPRELFWNTDDAFARRCFAALPIPVIGIPTSVLEAPWMLALLAHEVGHHVQADLQIASSTAGGVANGIINSFGTALKQSAQSNATASPSSDAWSFRGREVFADLYSLLCLGTATLPVLAEMLLTDENRMLVASDPRYPAPLVRWMLVRTMSEYLGLPPQSSDPHELKNQVSGAAAGAVEDLDPQRLRRLAAAGVDWIYQGHCFPELLGWEKAAASGNPASAMWNSPDVRDGGDLYSWSGSLEAGEQPVVQPELRSARLLVGAGVLAWAGLVKETDDAAREASLAQLGQRLLTQLPAVREQTTRAEQSMAGEEVSALSEALFEAPSTVLAGTQGPGT